MMNVVTRGEHRSSGAGHAWVGGRYAERTMELPFH